MGMVVRTNTMALNAYRQLGLNNSAVAKSLEKLASGYRINRAGDDAAGLAISEKMKAQITGLETASANAQDGISLIQTAEGNLSEVHDMLNRMVELSTKSANGTYTSTERQALQDEMDQLLDEIDRISQSANFNGTKLLNGTMGMNNEAFQIGASKGATVSGTNVITEGVEVPTDHISAGTNEVQPKFSIKFTDFKATVDAATNQTPRYNISLTIDGQTVNFLGTTTTFTSATNFVVTDNSNQGPTDVAGTDVVNALNGQYVQIGKDVYLAAKDDGSLNFTWKGTLDGTTYTDESTAKVTDSTWVPQGAVNVTIGAGTNANGVTPSSQHADCKVTKVDDPVVGADNLRAGASLDISKIVEALKNGSELKIGETTIKLDSSVAKDTVNGTAAAGYTIGTKDVADDDLVQYITEQLSNKDVTVKKGTQDVTFKINRETDSKIHIDEDETSGTANKYEGFTKAELEKVFSTVDKASNAYTTFKVTDNDKMGDTEKITIDGKDYEFAKGATADATLANLKTALGNAYQVSDPSGGSITIKATSATADAPVIAGSGLTLQIGDTADPYNKMTIKVADMSANGLGLEELKKTGIMTENKASDAIDKIKAAINTVSTTRAGMGALQNRLEHTINNLDVAAENLSAANSRIRDTDMAKEMMNYTKMNVLVQSAQAMLAQANQQPQSVLQLLQ